MSLYFFPFLVPAGVKVIKVTNPRCAPVHDRLHDGAVPGFVLRVRFYAWHITATNVERFAHPITFRSSLCSVCKSAAERWPMTRMTRPCSMVLKTGLSTDALMSQAPRQSSTMASP
jgi:hypothetical protein